MAGYIYHIAWFTNGALTVGIFQKEPLFQASFLAGLLCPGDPEGADWHCLFGGHF